MHLVRHSMTSVRITALIALALLTGCGEPETRNDPPTGADPSRLRTDREILESRPGDIQAILLERDALTRAERLARVLSELDPDALDDLLAAFESVYLDIGDFELQLFAEWWARFDPRAAMRWAQQDWRAEHMGIYQTVLRAWARDDPAAALGEAEKEPRPLQLAHRVSAVLRGWEEGGHPGAYEFVMSTPGEYGVRLTNVMTRRRVLRDGVDATFEWFESLPYPMDGTMRNLQRRVASAAAEVEPEKAAKWVEPYLAEEDRTLLAHRVGVRWVETAPEDAMAWLSALEAGQQDLKTGVKETYRAWLRLDREAAWAWLEAQEAAPWLDPALGLYAQNWHRFHRDEGEHALEKALLIDREDLRWSTVVNVWRAWLGTDVARAGRWFEEHRDQIPEFYRDKMETVPAGTVPKSKLRPAEG